MIIYINMVLVNFLISENFSDMINVEQKISNVI